MSTAKIYMKVRKDKSFLLKTYAVEALVFLALCTLVWNLKLSMEAHILMAPLGAIFGLMVASFIHNTSHSNIKNKVLNRVIGEFCGAWVLYGFSNFVMIHFLHHRYSDTDHDPVNPKGMSFLVFLFAPMRYMIKVAVGWLKEVHGKEKDYTQILATQTVLFHVNLVLKLAFWFMLLGPALFLCFYIPSLLANYGVHAHINYVCHSENDDGSIEILNLNHNLYYKFVNIVTVGGYYHKNHHVDLKLFNPMRLRSEIRTRTGATGLSVTEA